MNPDNAAGHDDVVVVIPTYNERDTLPQLVGRLVALQVTGLRVLVVDDNSPDGTGEVADGLAAETGGLVDVVHRAGKDGLGRAYVNGMQVALRSGASVVIQMDADLSHPADAIPRMLAELSRPGVDVVVGSRYVAGGSTSTSWPRRRRALSRAANAYIRRTLRLGVADATSGFKAWRAGALDAIDLTRVASEGYAFQVELGHACRELGLGVAEVPIHFEDRTHGRSKMTLAVQFESLLLPWRLRGRRDDVVGARHADEVEAPLPDVRVPAAMS